MYTNIYIQYDIYILLLVLSVWAYDEEVLVQQLFYVVFAYNNSSGGSAK